MGLAAAERRLKLDHRVRLWVPGEACMTSMSSLVRPSVKKVLAKNVEGSR